MVAARRPTTLCFPAAKNMARQSSYFVRLDGWFIFDSTFAGGGDHFNQSECVCGLMIEHD